MSQNRKGIPMTQAQQVELANEKVTCWVAKREHATAMLTKWQQQLARLQGARPTEPTAAKPPALVLSEKVVLIGKGKKTPPKPKK
jgi:ABC-type hemin transport system substrate-binding protein